MTMQVSNVTTRAMDTGLHESGTDPRRRLCPEALAQKHNGLETTRAKSVLLLAGNLTIE